MASTDYLKILIVTFNCGRELIKPNAFAQHLSDTLESSPRPDIIVFSLQEVAPVAYSFLGGSYLSPYFQSFRHAVDVAAKALGGVAKYVNIITRNVGMTACMVLILDELQEQIQWIETGDVGLGMHEMGNKGAVGVRLGYAVPNDDEVMDLTFVAAHLAPMEDGLERRNDDWKNIVRGLVFAPINGRSKQDPSSAEPNEEEESETLLQNQRRPQGIYTPTSHLLLAGDLNYRTSHTKPLPLDHLNFPQPTRDISDPRHFSHLLQNDQLSPERKEDRTCHGFSEAAIRFPPT
ncbi:MAG: hypothetical protein Q9183_007272, partial [Haloplaca sp. 2 TL-2023]